LADRDDLKRALERDLPSREARRLDRAASTVAAEVEAQEQILKIVAGTWYTGNRCLVVATSRRIMVSDGERLDVMRYSRLIAVDYHESWRKAQIMLRAQGAGATVRDIHLDSARELKGLIETARRSESTPGTAVPPGV
jgi:hypothetical protein